MSKKPNEPDPQQLRDIAEAQLGRSPMALVQPLPGEELPHELLHELRVHQIELEMQNEELRRTQLSLEESRNHYIDFYDFAPIGYLTVTDKGLISEINLTGAALLGVERNKLLQQRLARFITPEDNNRWHRHLLDVLKHDDKLNCELAFKRGDRPDFHAHLVCIRLLREGREPAVRIVLSDITERKQMDEVAREQEEFFRMIAENTDDFIAVLDLKGRRLYNSPSYTRLFGETERLKGTDSFAEIHPEDREHVKQVFRETVRSGTGLRADYRFVLADGSIRHMESRGGLIRNRQGHALRVVVVSRDVTARKLIEDEIRNLAFYDELTKQPNRRLLNDRLVQCMAASKRNGRYGALMFLDMDNFKPLNDTHGHNAGDLLLVEVARRICKCVRAVDTVSRFGGDEFLVMLSELDADKAKSIAEAGTVAEKIRVALAEPYLLTIRQTGKAETTVEHHCTSSIGVVLFIDQEYSAEDIIKQADAAMYQAKNGGRNQVRFFDPNALMETEKAMRSD
jgi:diguanylate cyclase (GGDEF)-like protein/PAS domain S-box-containing protein